MELPINILPDDQWRAILTKYGHGQVALRFRYQECDAEDPRFQGHTVVHGRNTRTGDLTSTGFLQDHNREIIAGIDNIPI
ncbi:hypothetical protein IMCC21224_1757 [Puniceibacterium sp. IMCC21224]|nr:hypothetical protein IMCC21224_1757 [Puniceibacterium sp. IMCC21224]